MEDVLADQFHIDRLVKAPQKVGVVEGVHFGGKDEEAVGHRFEAAELVEVGDIVIEVVPVTVSTLFGEVN